MGSNNYDTEEDGSEWDEWRQRYRGEGEDEWLDRWTDIPHGDTDEKNERGT